MPITDRKEAKDSGFAQIREALTSFEGDVVSTEFGLWGGKLVDEYGRKIPPKEFFEIVNTNIKVLKVSEELSMPIEDWTFRINCSNFKGSFWVDDFLASADEHNVLLPEGIVGKRVTWIKVEKVYNIKGNEITTANFVIAGVKHVEGGVKTPSPPVNPSPPTKPSPYTPKPEEIDPTAIALELAAGRTDAQFKSAIALHPVFASNPTLLSLAKAGALTAALISEGKLVLIDDIYQKP